MRVKISDKIQDTEERIKDLYKKYTDTSNLFIKINIYLYGLFMVMVILKIFGIV